MTDETTQPTETRESRLARQHKAAITNILEELVDAMESARKDGFITEFMVNRNPETQAFYLPPEMPALIKRW